VTDSPIAGGAAQPDDASSAAARLDALLQAAVARLSAAGARTEALGAVREPRGLGPFKSAAAIVPVGEAWRLGVLLVGTDGGLAAVGRITRATETGRPQNLSAGVEQRRAERVAATRGRFTAGTVVNFEFAEVSRDPADWTLADPLELDGDRIVVRWGAFRSESRELAAYLDDRIALLLDE